MFGRVAGDCGEGGGGGVGGVGFVADMYDAYGDESCGREYIAYGILLVPENQRIAAEAVLKNVKTSFGGHADDKLHCRELFAGDTRKKTPWAALEIKNVFDLYEELVRQLRSFAFRQLVTIAPASRIFQTNCRRQQWSMLTHHLHFRRK